MTMMLDKILATISILSLVAFMGVVAVFVNEPDLWIIIIVVLLMGVYDFYREISRASRKQKESTE